MWKMRGLGVVVLSLLGASGCAGVQQNMPATSQAMGGISPPRQTIWNRLTSWSDRTGVSDEVPPLTRHNLRQPVETVDRSASGIDIWHDQSDAPRLSRLIPFNGPHGFGSSSSSNGLFPVRPADRDGTEAAPPGNDDQASLRPYRGGTLQEDARVRTASTGAGAVPGPAVTHWNRGRPLAELDRPLPATSDTLALETEPRRHNLPQTEGPVALGVGTIDLPDLAMSEKTAIQAATRPRSTREPYLVPTSMTTQDPVPRPDSNQPPSVDPDQPPPIDPDPSQVPPPGEEPPVQEPPVVEPGQQPETAPPPGQEPGELPAQEPETPPAQEPATPSTEPAAPPEAQPNAPASPAPTTPAPAATAPAAQAPVQGKSQFVADAAPPAPTVASAQTWPVTPQASPKTHGVPKAKRWSLISWVQSLKHRSHKSSEPAVLASPQLPRVAYPTSYPAYAPVPVKAQPQAKAPSPQAQAPAKPAHVHATSQSPATCGGLHATKASLKSHFSWIHRGMFTEFFQKVKAKCPLHRTCECSCHEAGGKHGLFGGVKLFEKCGSGPMASPQTPALAPAPSIQAKGQSPLAATLAPEAGDVAERGEVLDRLAAHGLGEAP